MRIPEKMLITIVYKSYSIDIEVPTDLLIKDLKIKMKNILTNYFNRNKISESVNDDINVYYEKELLADEKLLVNYGIWDGSIITVR